MLEQMFEVTSTRFHIVMQMFVPLIDSSSIVAETCESVVVYEAMRVIIIIIIAKS